jgi:hypothetical protein
MTKLKDTKSREDYWAKQAADQSGKVA